MQRPNVASSHRPLRERGAVLIQVTVAILGLTAFSVLVLDYGVMWVARSQAQNAADSAALAAAVSLAYYDAEDIPRAKAAGVAAGQANRVWGQEPDITTDDVIIPYACPPGAPGPPDTCVRVNVFRNQGRDPLPVFFAPLLGISNQGVQAMAVAQVLIAQESDCVKPWAIPDKWDDHRTDKGTASAGWDWSSTYDRYSDKGSVRGVLLPQPPALDLYRPPVGDDPGSGFRLPTDYGTRVVLKFGNPHQTINSGWYFPVDLPRDGPITGGDKYRSNIASCNGVPLGPGDVIQNEPGNMKGPTDQGVQALIAGDPAVWDSATQAPACPSGSANCYTKRIISVPLFDVDDFMMRKDFCKNKDNASDPECIAQSDPVNGRFTMKIVKLLGFFIEGIPATGPNKDSVIGYFITYPGIFRVGGGTLPPSSFLRSVALVR